MTSSVQFFNWFLKLHCSKMRSVKRCFQYRSNGGIGVCSACQVALPACFFSSLEASHQLMYNIYFRSVRHINGRNNLYIVDAVDERKLRYRTEVVQPFAAKPKSWDSPLVNVIQDRWIQAGKAHLNSAAAPFSGHFYMLVLVLHWARVWMPHHFGSRMHFVLARQCVRHTTEEVDILGRHSLSCRKSPEDLSVIHRLAISSKVPRHRPRFHLAYRTELYTCLIYEQ